MNRFRFSSRRRVALVASLVLAQLFQVGCLPMTSTQLDELSDGFSGSVDFATDKASTFSLQGTQEHLGEFTAAGEVTFRPGETEGSLIGDGVAVFTTAGGDKLVGVVTWNAGPEDADGQRASEIRFSWRDSVQFADGTVAASDGKFENPDDRPPGLVVIAIIAILIGLLVPAVQK